MPIIFVSGHGTVPMSVRAMKAGALDFLQKPFDEQDLLDAVYRATERSRKEQAQHRELKALEARMRTLTPKEHEVFVWVITGLPNKNIADRLDTAEKTIKVHRASIMKKMNADASPTWSGWPKRRAYALSREIARPFRSALFLNRVSAFRHCIGPRSSADRTKVQLSSGVKRCNEFHRQRGFPPRTEP